MKPETNFKNKVVRMIKKEFPSALVMKLNDATHSGFLDLLIFYKAKCYSFELKVHPNKTSKIQDYFIQAIQSTGNFAGVAYELHDIKRVLENA